MIRVGVAGAAGRMGMAAVRRGRGGAEDMELRGRADPALGVVARRDPRRTATWSSTSRTPDAALANATRVLSRPACTS